MSNNIIIPVIIPYYKAPDQIKLTQACLEKQSGVHIETFIHDNSLNNLYFTKAINIGIKKFINGGFKHEVQRALKIDGTPLKVF